MRPKKGFSFGEGSAGSLRLLEISSLFLSFMCLSKIILLRLFAKSKLTSDSRVVVSEEDFPRRALVFCVRLSILLIWSLSISGI